jgi:glycosyltransferase involved in cell wall biosynthesis
MRIAVLAPASSIHTRRWVNSLAERGHTLLVVTIHPAEAGDYLPQVEVKSVGRSSSAWYYLGSWQARSSIRQFDPDVVHAHYASGYGTLARRVALRPLILSAWGSDVFAFPDRSRRSRRLVRRNLFFPDLVCATSRIMGRRVESLTDEQVIPAVVPFGVDTDVFRPVDGRKSNGTFTIGTIKTLAPIYRIDQLIRAFALVRNRGFDVELVIGGDGPSLEDLRRLAQDLAVHEHVTFLGSVPHSEVPSRLRTMDVFCILSVRESFGVSVIEASACAVPVVVTDSGGFVEVVLDEHTGYLVAPNNSSAAAQRIEDLLCDSALRDRFGQAGRAFVKANYEWSQCVDQMEALYFGIVAAASNAVQHQDPHR